MNCEFIVDENLGLNMINHYFSSYFENMSAMYSIYCDAFWRIKRKHCWFWPEDIYWFWLRKKKALVQWQNIHESSTKSNIGLQTYWGAFYTCINSKYLWRTAIYIVIENGVWLHRAWQCSITLFLLSLCLCYYGCYCNNDNIQQEAIHICIVRSGGQFIHKP